MTYREVLGSVAAQKIRAPSPANEVNWKSSMLFCQTLADAIEAYGTTDLPQNFAGTIEPFINSILECAISERTQLSVQACRVTGSLAKVLSKDMHPFIDRIVPMLIRHCASTKAVNQKSSAAAISNIIVHSTWSPRLLWHICEAFGEKNVGPRLQAPGWLLIILREYHKFLTSERDLDTIINSIHSGLVDADNNVRTKSRSLFWEYYKFDAEGAEVLRTKLNPHALTALDSDPGNPNKKSAKPKAKEPARPESSLAQMRQQAKKRLQETAAATTAGSKNPEPQNIRPSSITSANFIFGQPDLGDDVSDHRSKKSARDAVIQPQNPATGMPQPDSHHISKPASRPISIHKKTASTEGQVQSLNKKISAMEISGQTLHKKTSTSEGLRNSQNKKPSSTTTTVNDTHGPRSLLSGPVRRPRIVATPMNIPTSTSRPSSRTGHAQAVTTDPHGRNVRDTNPQHQKVDAEQITLSEPLQVPQPLQQIKTSRKIPRPEISSPVLIPEGKENANVYTTVKSFSMADGTPTASHVQRVIDHAARAAEAAQEYIAQQEIAAEAAAVAAETDLKDARRALTTAIGLLKADQMDYMGFRKLKNIVCNHGRELINDQETYNTLFDELIPRLGSIQELVYRGDPRDTKHPTYIRQAILHMVITLLRDYHPAWSQKYMGPSLATMMLARCTYSRNVKEHANDQPVYGQPYMHTNTTVELIMESMEQIVMSCPAPLDVLDSILDYLGAAEGYLMEHSDELKAPSSVDSSWRKAFASWDRYSEEKRLLNQIFDRRNPLQHADRLLVGSPSSDEFKEAGPEMPSKLPFLMETGLRIITPLLMRARASGQKLYPMQEALLCDLGQHLLTTYNAFIRRYVMPFCEQLYLSAESEVNFWAHFPAEADRNLLHYYLADFK